MADIVLQHDIADLGSMRRLSDQVALTAGGVGNATTVTSVTIDRGGFAGGSLPNAAEIDVLFAATLGSGNTLAVSFDVQDSPDGVNFSDFSTAASAVVATGPAGGGTVKSQVPFGVDLTGARRYVRVLFVPTLSATGTDTATAIAAGFFAGFDRLAAPV
jgi:hypothetical protein